jgi:hypothetical protein
MTDLIGYCLFCEDIRIEIGGTVSLVGVLPHGINVPELPFELGNLGVFTRLKLPLGWTEGEIRTFLVLPDGSQRALGVANPESIMAAASEMPADREYIEVSLTALIKLSIKETGYIFAYAAYNDTKIEMAKLAVTANLSPNPHID